jgi:Fe-S-cluster containining protein
MRQDANHRCVFLHAINGKGRCAIHALRPGPCRLFPFDVLYGKRHVSVGSQTMCPTSWLKNADMEARVVQDLLRWDSDLAEEEKLLAAWRRKKERDQSLNAFTWFAARRVARAMGIKRHPLLDPPRRTLGPALW